MQHLFSVAVVLAIASTLPQDASTNDIDEFNIAAGFIEQLEQNGNPAAMEFYSHIKEIQITLETRRSAHCQLNTLATSQDFRPAETFQSAMATEPLEMSVLQNTEHAVNASDGSPLNLSFLDDWIYDNALQHIRSEEQ